MPVAYDANAAYSASRSDAKAATPNRARLLGRPRIARRQQTTWVGNFYDHLTRTDQDDTLDVMDHQGPGRRRPAADTRRQPSWSWPDSQPGQGDPGRSADSGPQAVLGSPTGPQRAEGAGTGAQRLIGAGSGAHPVLGNGTGGQPTLSGPGGRRGRTPGRGFPPGHEQPETPPGGFWYPGEAVGYPGKAVENPGEAVENPHLPDDTDPITRVDPRPPRTIAVQAGGRRSARSARSAKAKPKRRLLSRPGLLAAVVVVVLAAGFGGYKFLYEPRVNAPVPPSLRLPTSAPGSPDFDQSLGKWQHIGSRTEDPAALTVAGLFPPQFVLDGSSYVRTAASVTKNCSQSVYGAQLQAALKSGQCSQVARASYLSGNGQLMGTVGVVNLDTSAAAQKAGQATGPQEVIAPLPAKTGATKKLGDGTGVVQAEVKGHYLILMWAQLADLKSPSTSATKQLLEQFAGNLVTGSANINLSTRMLGGKA
jgi:hypothetical protein